VTPPLASYRETIAFLEDLTARPILPREQVGLSRINALLDALDHPERGCSAIQVAGTAGKGSTTTMAATILREAGYRTGSFMSPHLQSYRERITLDGAPISEDLWIRAMNQLLPILDRMEANALPGYVGGRAAFLEVLWAMACLAYKEQGVSHVVVETGMGGRLDPTSANVASVAVVTNVSLDHVERLGYSVEEIALEKAGIIKHGQRVISAASEKAMQVLRAACQAHQAGLWEVGSQGDVTVIPETPEPDAPLTIVTPIRRHSGLVLGLKGAHQRLNAACAVAGVDALAAASDLVIAPAAVAAGLAASRIPGRLELLDGRPQVLLDGAHNVAEAEALAEALRTLYGGRRIVMLLGILGDKDYTAITTLLSALAAAVVVSEPPWRSRAGVAARIAAQARLFSPHVEEHDDPAEGFARVRSLAGTDDLIVVAGSLILVGAVRQMLVPNAAEMIS